MKHDDVKMAPAGGVHAFYLEHDCVLFDETAQCLFHLNAMAGYVWCLMESGLGKAGIAEALAEAFDLTVESARDTVERTFELLDASGVLQDSVRCVETAGAAPVARPEPGFAQGGSDGPRFSCQLLGSAFDITMVDAAQLHYVRSMLGHLERTSENPVAGHRFHIQINQNEEQGIRIDLDGECMRYCHTAEQMAPLLKSLVWQTAVLHHDFFLDIHAGVVGDGRQCLLFPAAAGSGKTTLTAAMVNEGFEYFTDEVALLSLPDMCVEPMPMAMCVKDTGLAALSSMFPALTDLPEHVRGDGKRVRYLRPPAAAIPQAGARRPVSAIVFPRYTPEGETRLTRLSVSEALSAFLHECLVISRPLDVASVSQLLDWFVKTPCYQLNIRDTGESVRAIRHLLGVPMQR